MTISSQVICSRHDAVEKLFISAIKLQTLIRVFCRVRMSLKKIGEKHQINNLVAYLSTHFFFIYKNSIHRFSFTIYKIKCEKCEFG